jgi:hypothetical protein
MVPEAHPVCHAIECCNIVGLMFARFAIQEGKGYFGKEIGG